MIVKKFRKRDGKGVLIVNVYEGEVISVIEKRKKLLYVSETAFYYMLTIVDDIEKVTKKDVKRTVSTVLYDLRRNYDLSIDDLEKIGQFLFRRIQEKLFFTALTLYCKEELKELLN